MKCIILYSCLTKMKGNTMTQDIKLAKKYQKFRDEFLDSYNDFNEFEEYGFNYIGVGKFFDVLNELEKNGFDISNKKVELNAFQDEDGNQFGVQLYIESECSDDKMRSVMVEVGTYNNQSFCGKMTNVFDGETEWGLPVRYEYETNEPLEHFCYVSIYGSYFNDDDIDEECYFDRKDMEKVSKFLKFCLKSSSPDEIVKEFEKIQ